MSGDLAARGPALGRRAFLGLAVTAGAAAAGLVGSTSAGAASRSADPWRLAVFRPLVGQRLAVEGGGELRVAEVVDRSALGGEVFTVLLEPHGTAPEASLFRVTHPALGTVVLGATAVGSRGRLQAVVDRRRPPVSSQES